MQVGDVLASNFKEGIRDRLETGSSEPSLALPDTSRLGTPLLQKIDAGALQLSAYHCTLCQADEKVKVCETLLQERY